MANLVNGSVRTGSFSATLRVSFVSERRTIVGDLNPGNCLEPFEPGDARNSERRQKETEKSPQLKSLLNEALSQSLEPRGF